MSLPAGTISHGVALYDPETGRIAHIQRVQVLPGAPDLTSEQVVGRAHLHARHGGHDVARLQVVHLADDHDYRAPHVVDVSTGAVVAAPPSGRGLGGSAAAG
jgi:hypothetical protein